MAVQDDEPSSTVTPQPDNVDQASGAPVDQPVAVIPHAAADEQSSKQTQLNFVVNGELQESVNVSTGSSIKVNFQTNDYVDGDRFAIKIHPVDSDFDISGRYRITPANDKPYQATVSNVAGGNNQYQFTDTMKGAGTYSQIIAISPVDDFNTKRGHKDGIFDVLIDVYKNDDLITSTTFHEVVKHSQNVIYLESESGKGSLHNIYTTDGKNVTTGVINPNEDYMWRLRLSLSPLFNQGSTLTLPVPEHFQLNEAATIAQNSQLFNNYHASIQQDRTEQDGNVVTLSLPKLTDAQIAALNVSKSEYKEHHLFFLVGQIDKQPAETTLVSGAGNVRLDYNNGAEDRKDEASPLQAKVRGTNQSVDQTPIGHLLDVSMKADKDNYLYKFDQTQPEFITTKEDSEKEIHALNKNVELASVSSQKVTNIEASVIVPDGMNVSSITLATEGNDSAQQRYQYEYLDGSRSEIFDADHISTAPNGQFIKKIHVFIDEALPYHQLFSMNLMGVLANQYRGDSDETAEKYVDKQQPQAGDPVANLDHLTTKVEVSLADSATNQVHQPNIWRAGQIVLDKNPDTTVHLNKVTASGHQSSFVAGDKHYGNTTGGYINIDLVDFQDEYPDADYYVVMPQNALLNKDEPLSYIPQGAEVSYLTVDGREVVKIHLSGQNRSRLKYKMQLNLDNASIITNQSLESKYYVYAAFPEGQKLHDKNLETMTYTPVADSQELAFVENHQNAYRLTEGNWTLVTSVVTQTTTEAKGNRGTSFGSAGVSNDTGSPEMAVTSSIINGEPVDVTNVVTIMRLPNVADGASQFDFTLNGPVHVIDVNAGNKVVADGIQVFYTTDDSYKSRTMESIDTADWQNDFTTTVDDWSKVTAVAVKFDSIGSQKFYRIMADGLDKTLTDDAEKIAYVSNKIWGTGLLEKNINAGKKSAANDSSLSASLEVVGESTLKVKLHYKGADGADHYIDVNGLKLKNNVDTLTLAKVLEDSFGITESVLKNADLTMADVNKLNDSGDFKNSLISKYPELADYAIDFAHPSDPAKDPANQGQRDYANGSPDKAAAWNQKVQYYFDGDQVVFELTKLEPMLSGKLLDLERDHHFLSNLDPDPAKPIHEPIVETIQKDQELTVQFDPLTGEYLVRTSYMNEFNQDTPKQIPGYVLVSPKFNLLTYLPHSTMQKFIEEHKAELFNPANKTGKILKIERNWKTGKYSASVTDDPKAQPGRLRVQYSETREYAPSHANLITMFPGQDNQVEISNNLDDQGRGTDKITFTSTDDDLKREGYTYQVYYVDSKYDGAGGRTPDEVADLEHKFVKPDWAIDTGKPYASLADALKAHPYDQKEDFDNSEPNDGTIVHARYNTHNFVVVYTPITEKPQDIYITSDNDPYGQDDFMKYIAIPQTIVSDQEQQQKLIQTLKTFIARLDQDREDQIERAKKLLALAEAGDFVQVYKLTGQGFASPSSSDDPFTSFAEYQYFPSDTPKDDNYNESPFYPFVDYEDTLLSQFSSSRKFLRNGYYIDKVTLTDQQGLRKPIVITNQLDLDRLDYSSPDSTGDSVVLRLLEFLLNKDTPDFNVQLSQADETAYQIEIQGLDNSPTYKDEDGNKLIAIANGDRFVFNATDYNGGQDSNPQIINFHYAPILQTDPEKVGHQVHVTYVDATGMTPLDEDQIKEIFNDNGVSLPEGTKYAGRDVSSSDILEESKDLTLKVNDDQSGYVFDNSAEDKEILAKLAEQGYYVVQRDQETNGQHDFNVFASDISTHEYNDNRLDSTLEPGSGVEQNYYVFLVRGNRVTYKVALEDKDGNVIDVLEPESILGFGQTGNKFAATPAGQDQSSTKKTIKERYDEIIQEMAKKYPNYSLVTADNTDPKLQKTDQIGADEVFEDGDVAKTIYLVPKYGGVTIHYVDVDVDARKNPDKKEFTSTDGQELANHQQTPVTDAQYGSNYENTPWNYGAEGYELATASIPEAANSGKVNDGTQDVYVYLKHKHSTIKAQPITVNETVHYLDQDGKTIKDESTAKMTLTPQGYYDEQSKKDVITGWTSSLPDSKFPALNTAIDGYDVDRTKTKATDVNADFSKVKAVPVAVGNDNQKPGDIDITVYYNQKAETHIHYIDVNGSDKTSGFSKDDGTAITGHDVDHVGHINDAIFPDGNNPWNYTSDGWVLAENPSNVNKDMKLTKDTPKDIYVYLKHDTSNPLKGAQSIHVTETIYFVDENGKPVADNNGQSSVKRTNTITLNPQGYFDKVANQNVITGWTTADGSEFPAYDLPEFSDYFATSASYKNQDGDTVPAFDKDHQRVNPVSFDATKVPSTTTEDQNVDVTVVLKKKRSALQTQSKAVKEVIQYVDQNGKPLKGETTKTIMFTPKGYHDNQTDQDVITGWEPSGDFTGDFTKDGNDIKFGKTSTIIPNYELDFGTDKTNPNDLDSDHQNVHTITITPDSDDIQIVLHYKQAEHDGDNPGGHTPGGDPENPGDNPAGNPDHGNETPGESEPSDGSGADGDFDTPKIATNEKAKGDFANHHKNGKQALPQTGNDHSATALVGLAMASLTGLFGLAGRQNKKQDN